MKIVVLDGYGLNPGDLSWEELEKSGELKVYPRTAPAEVVERARDAQIVITNKTVLDADTIAKLPEMRYIGVLATGYNVVDIEAAAKAGVIVTNIPAYSTMSVAQMVFALLMAITNRVEHFTEEIRRGRWSECPDFCYWDSPLMELAGKKIGIVGFGHIGQAVARIAVALEMEPVIFTSRAQQDLPEMMVKAESLDQLFSDCDIVTLHCPLTDDTYHLVDRRRLSLMKKTAILINTGRGPLLDEKAVAEALNEERIYAAAMDVLSTEPPKRDNPLLSARNCYITPHVAWASFEARQRLMKIAVENVRAFLHGTPVNVVN